MGAESIYYREIAVNILNILMQTAIQLEMAWIPREKNQQADYLSRLVDHDGWMVNLHMFQWIVQGPHTIDRFASHYNQQTCSKGNKKTF